MYNTKVLKEEDKKNMLQIRDSNIAWLSDDWIQKEIKPFIDIANRDAKWNYDWDCNETVQFTKYDNNQYYDWHKDEWNDVYNESYKYKGKVRKLSVTCALNNGNEYEGGELEFQFRDLFEPESQICELSRIKGSVIVFPSYIFHRVRPVLSGTRYSLVMWTLGEPWK